MKKYKDMSDQELDSLFQGAAGQDIPDFEPSAWDAMNKLLDENEPPKAGGFSFRKGGLLITAILLMSSIVYLTYQKWGTNSNNDLANETEFIEENNSLIEKSKGSDLSTGVVEGEGISDHQEVGGESRTLNTSGHGRPAKKEQVAENSIELERDQLTQEESELKLSAPRSNARIENSKEFKTKTYSRNSSLISKETNSRKTDAKESGSGAIAKNLTAQNSNTSISSTELKEEENSDKSLLAGGAISLDEVQIEKTKKWTSEIDGLQKLDPELKLNGFASKKFETVASPEVSTEELVRSPKLALRLAVSPDFSTVVQNPFVKVGHNIGGLLELRLKDRWHLQTGVIKSLKFYSAQADQYEWPQYWGSERPSDLTSVDARCNMLDIPLNVRYDLTKTRNTWFVSAGLTNYIMLNEQYDYIYESEDPDRKWTSWEGKTGFYDAGDINFSFGLEKTFARSISLQVEPFVKVPIQNIGFGKVKLLTTGVFFSTKIPLIR
ncbi:hypothetical protein [Jiulongibacter sp. NS-SX5]|uniref:hypothetical protein n=1 Tax=Jiulongibacter sp. NS-SX5 TaxID=3463854 RepID=UPI0040598A5A